MRILLSNDDGVHSPGLAILQKELRKLGKVWTVAPLEEKSTTGHSLTIHKPLRVIEMSPGFYGVSGSPADCVYLGIRHVIGSMPDLVVSGINRGANLGQDVYYSGTVSAAREACILGIRSIAVSLAVDFKKMHREQDLHYASAAKICAQVIRKLKSFVIPKHTLININVPDKAFNKIKGVRLAHQGFRHYSGSVLRRTDHRGRDYFWVGGQYKGFRADPSSDCDVVDRGLASVTPIQLNCTDYDCMDEMAAILKRE